MNPEMGLAQAFAAEILEQAEGDPVADLTIHDSAIALSAAVARDAYALGVTAQSARGTARSLPLAGACGFSPGGRCECREGRGYPLTAAGLFLPSRPAACPSWCAISLTGPKPKPPSGVVGAGRLREQKALTRSPFGVAGEVRLANAVAGRGRGVSAGGVCAPCRDAGRAERLSRDRSDCGTARSMLDAQCAASAARLAAGNRTRRLRWPRPDLVDSSDGEGRAEVNLRPCRMRRPKARARAVSRMPRPPGRIAWTLDVGRVSANGHADGLRRQRFGDVLTGASRSVRIRFGLSAAAMPVRGGPSFARCLRGPGLGRLGVRLHGEPGE